GRRLRNGIDGGRLRRSGFLIKSGFGHRHYILYRRNRRLYRVTWRLYRVNGRLYRVNGRLYRVNWSLHLLLQRMFLLQAWLLGGGRRGFDGGVGKGGWLRCVLFAGLRFGSSGLMVSDHWNRGLARRRFSRHLSARIRIVQQPLQPKRVGE